MTDEIYQLILSIVGFLFVIMLAIIGYFLKKQVEATEKLELSTNSLDKTVSLLQFNNQSIDKTLTDHNSRINENTKMINEHSEVLASLTKPRKRINNG